MTHLTPDLLEFLEHWLPDPPARLLEVGCGDGALARELAARGYRITAIDPEPPAGEPFVRSTLEDYRADAPFDAAVAIRSLHHVGDLDVAIESLARALRPGARVVLFEFAVEHVDADARRWLAEVGLDREAEREFEHVIALGDLRRALGERFRELVAEPTGYLGREASREDLHERELASIARGELRPVGARLAFEFLE